MDSTCALEVGWQSFLAFPVGSRPWRVSRLAGGTKGMRVARTRKQRFKVTEWNPESLALPRLVPPSSPRAWVGPFSEHFPVVERRSRGGGLCTLIRTLKPAGTRRSWPESTVTVVLSRTPLDVCRDSGMRYHANPSSARSGFESGFVVARRPAGSLSPWTPIPSYASDQRRARSRGKAARFGWTNSTPAWTLNWTGLVCSFLRAAASACACLLQTACW